MYERFFGLTAAPFQLNPDPSFYFQSAGHHSAHQYLRFGAFQGEGFIVVTGEIGAGKTTLLRTLLAELDPTKVVAAQIVSTQLQADELLSAVALAFGVPCDGMSKAKLLVTLEAYLASLATTNRRALLIIDEAQNLGPAAIEELRMLSNFQFGNKALLQSFLVGQPELREVLRLPQMEQLRQRIIASTHIGPMEADETRRYIEHRLHHVGWSGRPSFSDDAYAAIHARTDGVPRRINTLCSRLLLSAFLDGCDDIDAARVHRVAREIQLELTGSDRPRDPPSDALRPQQTTQPATPLGNIALDDADPGSGGRAAAMADNVVPLHRAGASTSGPIVCVAASQPALVAAAALLHAFGNREDLPPARLLVLAAPHVHADTGLLEADVDALDLRRFVQPLQSRGRPAAQQLPDLGPAIADHLATVRASALVVADDTDIGVLCAVAARQAGIPVVRIHAGLRNGDRREARESNRILIDQTSTLLCASERGAVAALQSEGVPESWIELTGNPLIDALRRALPAAPHPEATLAPWLAAGSDVLTQPSGYGLVLVTQAIEDDRADFLAALHGMLLRIATTLPLVWPAPQAVAAALSARRPSGQPDGATIVHTAPLPCLELIGLLRGAACVFTDAGWIQDLATALGIPCLTLAGRTERQASLVEGTNRLVEPDIHAIFRALSDILHGEGHPSRLPALWDGHAADRIALQVSNWLLAHRDGTFRAYLDDARTPA